jgi:hypothetical protein
MSRYYGMSVTICGHKPEAAEAIREAASDEWPFEEWHTFDGKLTAYAESNLCGGETEAEFTERLAVPVWLANGAYCDVSVDATYLDELPYDTHSLDEDDYARLIEGKAPHGEGSESQESIPT